MLFAPACVLVEHSFAKVGPALQGMDHWCDILILHINVKKCAQSSPKAGDTLSLNIGRKFDQPLADAQLFEFLYKVGPAGEVVANAADSGKFDLVMLGSHGHGAIAGMVLGSVASRVLASCKVPLLIVR